MSKKVDWDPRLGRHLKLRDLQVFFAVVQRGSMAKAAAQLGISQPAVTEVIASLEHAIGVRLFDRTTQGVHPTNYGRVLLKRGTAAFDELTQSIREIEFLVDPNAGELRIGCAESIASSILPPIIQGFSNQYPEVVVRVRHVVSPMRDLPELRERSLDLVFDRLVKPLGPGDDDLNVENLFDDEMIVAAGAHSPWAHRDKIDLTELVNERWVLTPPDSWYYQVTEQAFRARDLDMPKVHLMSFSAHLRANLLATGPFISAFPSSFLRFNAHQLAVKALRIDLPTQPWPVLILTLKNRTLNPLVQRFIEHARAFTRSLGAGHAPERKSA